jgi:hypothetical protein
MKRQMSEIDRSKGEFNVIRADKKITIFKESTGVGRQLMATIEVMKKREGRLRVHITWQEGKEEDAKVYDCFCDLNFSEAIVLVDAPSNLVPAIHANVVELSRYLKDYANVVEVGDGEAHVVKLCSQEVCSRSLPDAPRRVSPGDGPSTSEITTSVELRLKKIVPVVDAPDTGLERGVELDIHITNSRRPGVLDITSSPTKRDTPLTSRLPPGSLRTSVGIPTLISLDQEHTDSYVKGLIESLNVKLDNGNSGANEVEVGPRLHVKGGRPTTRAASRGKSR